MARRGQYGLSDSQRYSDDGLKVLFSPAMGFETIRAGMYSPLRMYFDRLQDGQESFADVPCFGNAIILARKISEMDRERFRWDVRREDVLGSNSHYPPKDSAE